MVVLVLCVHCTGVIMAVVQLENVFAFFPKNEKGVEGCGEAGDAIPKEIASLYWKFNTWGG